MTSTSSTSAAPDPMRAMLHAMWGAAAAGWAEHASFVEQRGEVVTHALLAAARVGEGDRVLELGCGPGAVGIAAAAAVGRSGFVVLSDVAPAMLAIAAERSAAAGLANTTTKVLDLEQVDEPDESFDVVLCREALMLVADPGLALREVRRVLLPGGRVALAVWGARERNPWLAVLLDAVSAAVGVPVPPPGVPGPFSLADVAGLRATMAGSGLADVEVRELDTPMAVESFEAWWQIVPALAGPVGSLLSSLPAEQVDAIRAAARSSIGADQADGRLDLPGLSLVAAGRRPA